MTSTERLSNQRRILAVLGHPTRKSFGGALMEAYTNGAIAFGCAVDVMDLSTMAFDATPVGRPGLLDPELAAARDRIMTADHLLLVYPTWLGAMPARMKGFFELVFGNDWAFSFQTGKLFPQQKLKGRSADVLVTMDTPPLIYRLLFGAPGHKMVRRAILGPSGIAPIKLTAFGPLGRSTEQQRSAWLAKTRLRGERIGRALASAGHQSGA